MDAIGQGLLLAAEAAEGGGFNLRNFIVFVLMTVILVGSVWLLLAMILGARLGYLVMGACFSATMLLLALIWVITALGPKGAETTWFAVGVGPDLSSVESEHGTFDVSAYPGGSGWEAPSTRGRLADLKEGQSTQAELNNAIPVMEALVADAISEIPGKRSHVEDLVQGEVGLVAGEFQVVSVEMREATVDGKPSIVAVGKAVPSGSLIAGELPGGAAEGEITRFLVRPGAEVSAGTPMLEARTEGGTVQVTADRRGRLISFGLRVGDAIKPGVPYAFLDLSGQGGPEPVEVAAARVRGSVRTPSVFYIVGTSLLFGLHMLGLRRMERPRRRTAEPVPSS